MAAIRKRGARYQVQVWRKGQQPVTKSLLSRADALAWARNAEANADRDELAVMHSGLQTVGGLLRRYETQIASKKRLLRRAIHAVVDASRPALCGATGDDPDRDHCGVAG